MVWRRPGTRTNNMHRCGADAPNHVFWHTEDWKMVAMLQTTSKMHFLETFLRCCDSNFTISKDPIESKLRLARVTNWPTCHYRCPRDHQLIDACNDDVIKWKHVPRSWHFVREIQVTGEFPSQRPATRSFGVFLDLRLNKRLSKQSRRWWFETPSRSLWRQCNVIIVSQFKGKFE